MGDVDELEQQEVLKLTVGQTQRPLAELVLVPPPTGAPRRPTPGSVQQRSGTSMKSFDDFGKDRPLLDHWMLTPVVLTDCQPPCSVTVSLDDVW